MIDEFATESKRCRGLPGMRRMMMIVRPAVLLPAIALTLGLMASPSIALDKFKMRVLGNYGNQPHSDQVEKPWFTKKLQEASNGNVEVDFRTVDEVGLKGTEVIRLLKQGGFDIVAMQLGFISGDVPFVTGVDLPGVSPDMKTARMVAEAYRPPFDEVLRTRFNGTLLALWPYPSQIFYCNAKISGLDDLKGKKIRVYSPAMAKLVQGLGAIGVTVPFQEVYQSLQRGVVDCAISGSTGGNAQKWFEVSTHLYTVSVGWGLAAHVANLDFWNKRGAEGQAFLMKQMSQLDNDMWDLVARLDEDAVNCNTGRECRFGNKGNMTLVSATDADRQRIKKLVEDNVLPSWAEDCGKTLKDCASIWNSTAGKVLGISVKK